MTFFRLLKPDWGRKFIERDGEKVDNPDLVEEVKGKTTIEGIFEAEYVAEKNEAGYNIYWFPNHPSKDVYSEEKSYLNGRDIDVFEWLFVDMDLKDGIYKTKEDFYAEVEKFELKPTLTVDSGNGVHVYWQMEDLTRDTYPLFQKRLIQKFQTDDSIWTVLQIMRFPGSKNTKKHGNFKQTEIIEKLSLGKSYTLDQFHEVLPEITPKNIEKVQAHLDKLDGKLSVELSENINSDELPDKFLSLLYKDDGVFQLFTNPKQTYGDRSGADAKLANILCTKNFNRREAVAVIANTSKALSKGANRLEYAANTVEFAYGDRIQNKFKTVGENLKSGRATIRGEPVNGPDFFDCLHNKWRKGQVLGLIAGSGVGKTSIALKTIKDMIQNNPDNDDVFIFFSLEMPEYEIEERWVQLVGKKSTLADRLYVIGNEDANGDPRNITLQDIHSFCQDIKKNTGKNIGSVIIDHIGIVNPMINLKKKPTFGAEGDLEGGYGNNRALSLTSLCKAMKMLSKMLDTFLIVLTQTTKSKGAGDTPIDKDGAFGTASYEWMMDAIISCWQPLMRIHKDTDLRVLAWQYVKIRNKHKQDPITTHDPQTLFYEMETGDLRPMSMEEYQEFETLLPLAIEARKANEKKESNSYSRGPNLADLKKLNLGPPKEKEKEIPREQAKKGIDELAKQNIPKEGKFIKHLNPLLGKYGFGDAKLVPHGNSWEKCTDVLLKSDKNGTLLKIELENGATQDCWKESIPYERWVHGLNLTERKAYKNCDLFIKFSKSMESAFIVKGSYVVDMVNKGVLKKKRLKNSVDNKTDTNYFYSISWEMVEKEQKRGNVILIENNDYGPLLKCLEEMSGLRKTKAA